MGPDAPQLQYSHAFTAWISLGVHGAPVATVATFFPDFRSYPTTLPWEVPGVHSRWPQTAAAVRVRSSAVWPSAPRGKSATFCTPGVPPL